MPGIDCQSILQRFEVDAAVERVEDNLQLEPTSSSTPGELLSRWLGLLPGEITSRLDLALQQAIPFMPPDFTPEVVAVANHHLPFMTHVDIICVCLSLAMGCHHWTMAAALIYTIDRALYRFGRSKPLLRTVADLRRVSPSTALAPQVTLRRARVMKDEGDLNGALKVIHTIISREDGWQYKEERQYQDTKAACLHVQGQIYHNLELWHSAIPPLVEGFQIFRQVQDRKGIGSVLHVLSRCLCRLQQQQYDEFRKCHPDVFEQADPCYEGYRQGQNAVHHVQHTDDSFFVVKHQLVADESLLMYAVQSPCVFHFQQNLRQILQEIHSSLGGYRSVRSLQNAESFVEFVRAVYLSSLVLFHSCVPEDKEHASKLETLSLKLYSAMCCGEEDGTDRTRLVTRQASSFRQTRASVGLMNEALALLGLTQLEWEGDDGDNRPSSEELLTTTSSDSFTNNHVHVDNVLVKTQANNVDRSPDKMEAQSESDVERNIDSRPTDLALHPDDDNNNNSSKAGAMKLRPSESSSLGKSKEISSSDGHGSEETGLSGRNRPDISDFTFFRETGQVSSTEFLAVEQGSPDDPEAAEQGSPDDPEAVKRGSPDDPEAVEQGSPDDPEAVEQGSPDDPEAEGSLSGNAADTGSGSHNTAEHSSSQNPVLSSDHGCAGQGDEEDFKGLHREVSSRPARVSQPEDLEEEKASQTDGRQQSPSIVIFTSAQTDLVPGDDGYSQGNDIHQHKNSVGPVESPGERETNIPSRQNKCEREPESHDDRSEFGAPRDDRQNKTQISQVYDVTSEPKETDQAHSMTTVARDLTRTGGSSVVRASTFPAVRGGQQRGRRRREGRQVTERYVGLAMSREELRASTWPTLTPEAEDSLQEEDCAEEEEDDSLDALSISTNTSTSSSGSAGSTSSSGSAGLLQSQQANWEHDVTGSMALKDDRNHEHKPEGLSLFGTHPMAPVTPLPMEEKTHSMAPVTPLPMEEKTHPMAPVTPLPMEEKTHPMAPVTPLPMEEKTHPMAPVTPLPMEEKTHPMAPVTPLPMEEKTHPMAPVTPLPMEEKTHPMAPVTPLPMEEKTHPMAPVTPLPMEEKTHPQTCHICSSCSQSRTSDSTADQNASTKSSTPETPEISVSRSQPQSFQSPEDRSKSESSSLLSNLLGEERHDPQQTELVTCTPQLSEDKQVHRAVLLTFDVWTGQWRRQSTLIHMGEALPLASPRPGGALRGGESVTHANPRGAFRDAFLVSFLHQGEPLARYVGKKYRKQRPPKEYMRDVTDQMVASYYVTLFNEALSKRQKECLTIHFLPAFHLQVVTAEGQVCDWLNVEPYMDGRYAKITNNAAYLAAPRPQLASGLQVATAFTHFSFVCSQGRYMVVDLQGCVPDDNQGVIYLTDPVLHSIGRSIEKSSAFDRHEQGMADFFQRVHTQCNAICRLLHLDQHRAFCD